MRMEIAGSIVFVTGASSGIGAAAARELARQGAIVVLMARREAQLRSLAAEIERTGGRALACVGDISQRADIDRCVQQAIDQFGRIDVLVNNAGIGAGSSVLDSDDQAMQQIIDVNLLGPARCVQAVLPRMRRQGRGVIINIGSVAGEVATSGLYSATKFGLRGLNDALRRELRRDRIAVVLIAPGFVRTEMTSDVRLPMPGPQVIARAIADAIRHPRRVLIVPWYYRPAVWISILLPWLIDWVIGGRAVQQEFRRRNRGSNTRH